MKKLFLVLAFLQVGCASKFYIPGNRFLIPESGGDWLKGDLKVGGVGVTQVQVADDITSASPNLNPELIKNSSVSVGLQLGLLSRLDAYYNNVSGAADIVGLKVQLLGDSNLTAKANNFSFALAGGAQFRTVSTSLDSGGNSSTSKIKLSGYEAMALIGFRLSDNVLFYTNPFVNKVNADVQIQRTSSGFTTTTAEPNGTGEMKGAAIGMRFGKGFYLDVEVALTETIWTRTNPTELKTDKFSDSALGVALGGTW